MDKLTPVVFPNENINNSNGLSIKSTNRSAASTTTIPITTNYSSDTSSVDTDSSEIIILDKLTPKKISLNTTPSTFINKSNTSKASSSSVSGTNSSSDSVVLLDYLDSCSESDFSDYCSETEVPETDSCSSSSSNVIVCLEAEKKFCFECKKFKRRRIVKRKIIKQKSSVRKQNSSLSSVSLLNQCAAPTTTTPITTNYSSDTDSSKIILPNTIGNRSSSRSNSSTMALTAASNADLSDFSDSDFSETDSSEIEILDKVTPKKLLPSTISNRSRSISNSSTMALTAASNADLADFSDSSETDSSEIKILDKVTPKKLLPSTISNKSSTKSNSSTMAVTAAKKEKKYSINSTASNMSATRRTTTTTTTTKTINFNMTNLKSTEANFTTANISELVPIEFLPTTEATTTATTSITSNNNENYFSATSWYSCEVCSKVIKGNRSYYNHVFHTHRNHPDIDLDVIQWMQDNLGNEIITLSDDE